MGRQVPCGGRESNADIPADLSDPDGLAAKRQLGQPQTQVKSFADRFSNLLQRNILAPSEQVERTNGRIPVLGTKKERLGGLPAR